MATIKPQYVLSDDEVLRLWYWAQQLATPPTDTNPVSEKKRWQAIYEKFKEDVERRVQIAFEEGIEYGKRNPDVVS